MRTAHSYPTLLLIGCWLLLNVQGLPHPQEHEEEGGGAEQTEVPDRFSVAEDPEKGRQVDEDSEAFFSGLADESDDLVGAPASYDAVKLGLVTPARDVGLCNGADPAFATAALVEACYAKLTGKTGGGNTVSEQWMMDCGYGYANAGSCAALFYSYVLWLADKKQPLVVGAKYRYRGDGGDKVKCPARLPAASLLAPQVTVAKAYYTYDGNEVLLKNLVAERGAVGVDLYIPAGKGREWEGYSGGIFDCTGGSTGWFGAHISVAVVGYGNEGGQDFWLIKHSKGPGWGLKGFMKLRRGVGSCNVGRQLFTVECVQKAAAATALADCGEEETCPTSGEEDVEDGEK